MQWLTLLAIALIFALIGKALKPVDEVCALAGYSAGVLSGLWGLAIAPTPVQIALEALTCGWLQVITFRTRARMVASASSLNKLDRLRN